MNVRWTRPALEDLNDIYEFISAENPAAAARVGRAIRLSVERLEQQPNSGRPGRVAGTRELVVRRLPYLVAYRIQNNTVEILAVRHGARRWPLMFD